MSSRRDCSLLPCGLTFVINYRRYVPHQQTKLGLIKFSQDLAEYIARNDRIRKKWCNLIPLCLEVLNYSRSLHYAIIASLQQAVEIVQSWGVSIFKSIKQTLLDNPELIGPILKLLP